jgi:hypothetical protein
LISSPGLPGLPRLPEFFEQSSNPAIQQSNPDELRYRDDLPAFANRLRKALAVKEAMADEVVAIRQSISLSACCFSQGD